MIDVTRVVRQESLRPHPLDKMVAFDLRAMQL